MLHNLSVKSVRLVNSSVKTSHRFFSTNPRVFELQQTRKLFNVNREFRTNLLLRGTITPLNVRYKKTKKGKEDTSVDEEGMPIISDGPATIKKGDSLDSVIQSLEKSYGKGSVMKLTSDPVKPSDLRTISTGSLGLDLALGVGGLARGRVTEVFGMESSGKTTLALQVIAEAHKLGGKCCFIDAEHALDPNWAKKLGVKLDDLLVCQPDTGEQALEIADTLIQSGTMDVIVIDSVSALVPKAELEGDMGALHPGAQARLMSQALRKLTGNLGRTNKTILIFINQIRHKIGVMFGSPETTSGGNALKYYASARLDVRKIGTLKTGENVIGSHIRVKVVKNKLAAPFKETTFDIEFGKGVSKFGELVDIAADCKLLEKSGAWYSYNGEKIAQGREKAKQFFESNPQAAAALEKAVREKFFTSGGQLEENTEVGFEQLASEPTVTSEEEK